MSQTTWLNAWITRDGAQPRTDLLVRFPVSRCTAPRHLLRRLGSNPGQVSVEYRRPTQGSDD